MIIFTLVKLDLYFVIYWKHRLCFLMALSILFENCSRHFFLPLTVDCGKRQTFCINLIWKYIKPVNLNIPHIEVYTVTVATHLYKINNSWLGGESFWLVCLQYNVNDNAAIEHAINSTPSRNLTAEVVDIQHIYNDMPKNPRYWWPTIYIDHLWP